MAKFALNANHIAVLVAIAATTAAGNVHFISAADGADLVKNGYIEVNTSMKDDNGNAAARLTDLGRASLPADNTQTEQTQTTAPAGNDTVSFVMETEIALPGIKRGSGNTTPRDSKYPLKDIPLGGAIFLPQVGADEKALKAASKQFGSMVATFNKNNATIYLTTRTIEDGKVAGFKGRNPDGTVNPEAYAGVPGIGIYHRPVSEKKVRAVKPKADATTTEQTTEQGGTATE